MRLGDEGFVSGAGGGVMQGPRRVIVYGVTGSGKTDLARRIASLTGLPWHSVDDEIGRSVAG